RGPAVRHPGPVHDGQPVPLGPGAGVARGLTRDIVEATADYEDWLRSRTEVVEQDVEHKHEVMALGPFPLLRATAYRWAERFPQVCPELAEAPPVMAVGDLHVENFGAWRDAEGRLEWGVNDVDEAAPLPYTRDLARLATSAVLSGLAGGDAASAILGGYAGRTGARGLPFVLAEHHGGLRGL